MPEPHPPLHPAEDPSAGRFCNRPADDLDEYDWYDDQPTERGTSFQQPPVIERLFRDHHYTMLIPAAVCCGWIPLTLSIICLTSSRERESLKNARSIFGLSLVFSVVHALLGVGVGRMCL